MTNPTVFPITKDDVTDIMWLVDNPEPIEMLVPSGAKIIRMPPQEQLDLIKATLAQHGTIFASFYRPGAFWEEEVFVCPKCKYATQIEFAEGVAPDEETLSQSQFYCKYCYTSWACSAERGMFRVKIGDSDGKEENMDSI